MSQSLLNDRYFESKARARGPDGAITQGQSPIEEWIGLAEQAARRIVADEPVCTVTIDPELIIREIDAAGAAWLELGSVDQAQGRSILDFIVPELHEAVTAAALMVFGGQMRHFRATAVTARGRRRIIDVWTSMASTPPLAEPRVIATVYDITELSVVEAERDLYASIVRTAPDPVITVSREQRIMSWNPAAEKLYGYGAREALGRGLDLYVPPEGLERVQALVARVIETGAPVTYEQRRLKRDGSPVDVWVAAFPTYDSMGNITGAAGIARDVTDQRATERKLQAERQYSRSLVESSLDALLVIDSSLVLTDVNRQAVRLSGYSREELVGIQLASIFTEPERVCRVVREALEKGAVHDAELELMTRQAEAVAVSLDASAYRDAEGAVCGVLISARDIAERKRAERERSLLAAIVNSSGDAIYSVTPDFEVSTWNAGAERLFGYKAAEIIGCNARLLVPLDMRGDLAERLERMRQGESLRYEGRRLHKDGGAIEVSIVASPIFGVDGRISAISIVARDISERKRIENELTAARDAALAAVQTRSRFLANMSHEIRTPLNSIIGMTGLLLDTTLSAEQSELARDVRDSGETLLSLINDILDFSKLAAGKMVLEEIAFDLAAAVEATVELAAGHARHKALELTTSTDPDVPRLLRGDPGRLRQALLNMVDNAIKFTERGNVTVHVSRISESTAEAVLRFEVRDTGVGIPRDKLGLLFKPFSQVDASTTRHFGGTGLGLSITRELAERMNGSVGVTSAPGVGSTFWFSAGFGKQPEAPRAEPLPSLAGRRVLIIDDDQGSREILARQVSAWGIVPEAVGCAEAALDAMRKASSADPFDVALVDLMMPGTDGIELARKIKGDPALAQTPLIVISSSGPMREYGERLRGVEISAWLMKPVAQSPLYDEIATAIAASYRRRWPVGALPAMDRPSVPPSADEIGNRHGIGGLTAALAARKLRVLVAEDNPINQKLTKLQLGRFVAHTDTVADGREAVEAATRVPYDVILMDCQMPGMDGYEATREIRRREGELRHTKIVAVTAHALTGDREKCLAAGMDDYVSKPVKADVLEEVLARVFSLTQQGYLIEAPPAGALSGDMHEPSVVADARASPDDEQNPAAEAAAALADEPSQAAAPVSQDLGYSSDSEVIAMESPQTQAYARVLDRATLDELRAEGDDLLAELFDMFVAEAPAGLQRITEAFDRDDLKTAGLQAHRLRGSAAGLGAKRMQELCGSIEQAARSGHPAEARASFSKLTSECRRVLDAIGAERVAARNGAPSPASNGRMH